MKVLFHYLNPIYRYLFCKCTTLNCHEGSNVQYVDDIHNTKLTKNLVYSFDSSHQAAVVGRVYKHIRPISLSHLIPGLKLNQVTT